jgi:hypothetical protein
MRKLLLLIAALTLLLAACRAEVNIIIDIDESGTGEVAYEIGFDEEFRDLIASSGGNPDDLLSGGADFGLAEGEQYERTEGDMTFVGYKQTFSSVTDIEADMSGDPDSPFQNLTYVQTDDTATLEALIAIPEEELGLGDAPIDTSQLTDEFFSFQLIFGMPGTVTESNADEVLSNGQLVWKIPITGGEKEIFAQSELDGSGSLWWVWLIGGIVLLLGLGALIGAVIVSRRQSQRAVASAGETYPQTAPVAGTAVTVESTTADSAEPTPDPTIESAADDAQDVASPEGDNGPPEAEAPAES